MGFSLKACQQLQPAAVPQVGTGCSRKSRCCGWLGPTGYPGSLQIAFSDIVAITAAQQLPVDLDNS